MLTSDVSDGEEFSLLPSRVGINRPTDSQERIGKKKRRPASLEMTGSGSGRIEQNGRVAASRVRMTAASPPQPTGVLVWTLGFHGGRVEVQESGEAKPPVRWGVC